MRNSAPNSSYIMNVTNPYVENGEVKQNSNPNNVYNIPNNNAYDNQN